MTDNLRQLPYGWAKRYIGHSPVGALFLIGMLMLALVVGASGWASSVAAEADWLNQFHAISANTLLVFAGFYIAAVAFGSWRAGDNVLLSMVRGTKLGSPDEAIQNARHGVWPCFWSQRFSASGGTNGKVILLPARRPGNSFPSIVARMASSRKPHKSTGNSEAHS